MNHRELGFYDIDSIWSDKDQATIYYVYHIFPDGHRVVVQSPCETYLDAEELKDELNADLLGANE